MSEPNLLPLDVYCKVCKKPFVTWYDAECPKEWGETLKPSLTCDKCYDEYLERVKREDEERSMIAKQRMNRGKVVKPSEEEKGKEVLRHNNQHWYERL